MKKIRRIAAIVLALVMIMSAPLQSINSYAVKEVDINTEANRENSMVISEEDKNSDAESNIKTPDNYVIQQEDGVVNGEDANNTNPSPVEGEEDNNGTITSEGHTLTEINRESIKIDLTLESSVAEQIAALSENAPEADELVPVIIQFDDKSIIEKNSDAKLNFITKIKMKFLEWGQDSVISKIEKKVLDGEELDIQYNYTWAFNGIATSVPYGLVEEIRNTKGVKEVYFQQVYEVADKDESAETHTIIDGEMIGREDVWEEYGYTGEGIKIAILDTGIDEDHQNFAALSNDKLTESSANQEFIESKLSYLNSYESYGTLTADQVYYNTKIAYAFNYADKNLRFNHASDEQGDHGTHVAGIAAANDLGDGGARGVAPDAQLYVMKVFGKYEGATTAVLMAAIEDALILDADVINMSLGSACGFSISGYDAMDELYASVAQTDTFLAISAGNSSTSGSGNWWGTDTNLTSNPDNATISSPAAYASATSVASVNNIASRTLYLAVDGHNIAYSDANNGDNYSLFELFAGQSLDYVMVGNMGQTLEDFTNADVEGKVAVVSRGLCSFAQKAELAEEAGAVACIIYNNVSGSMGMDFTGSTSTIPAVSVTQKAGQILADAKAADPTVKVFVSEEEGIVPSELAYTMSDFTSWGVAPNLTLEPDIAAPGGDIYSTRDGGTYGLMSGTSMASPNVAGMAALVKQYVDDQYPSMTDAQKHKFVNALLVSTSIPLTYDEELPYSPRVQGSGLANVHAAISTQAYLSVDGEDIPRANVFDNEEGVYNYSFKVHNFGEKALWYALNTNIQTEDYFAMEGIEFMSMTPVELSGTTKETSDSMLLVYDYNEDGKADIKDARKLFLNVVKNTPVTGDGAFRYNLTEDETSDAKDVMAYLKLLVGLDVEGTSLNEQVLKVEAGDVATVSVNVTVAQAGKDYMDAHFENGIYVEGYTFLEDINGAVDLSLPYLGFYGDWTEGPLFDSGYYWDDADVELTFSQYPHCLLTGVGGAADIAWFPGMNPYIDEDFDVENIAVSPNNDGYADYITDMYIALLRNANELTFTYKDAKTGYVYNESVAEKIEKSYYVPQYGQVVPYVYSWGVDSVYDFTYPEGHESAGQPLADGTVVDIIISGELDYDKHESNNDSDQIKFTVTVDTEAPVIEDSEIVIDEENGKQYLDLTIRDNHKTAAICVFNAKGTVMYDAFAVTDAEPGESAVTRIDVTNCGNEFSIVLGDYGFNERTYLFETTDNDPIVDDTVLYGYRVNDGEIQNDTLYGWLGINKEDASIDVMSSEYYMDYALTAAVYVGEYIVAVDANDDLVYIKPGYWDERQKITSLPFKVNNLAFDAKTGTLYAINGNNGQLVKIDIDTAEITPIGEEHSFMNVLAMAFDDDGNLYAINSSDCVLRKIDVTTGEWGTEDLLDTYEALGGYSSYAQSMTYDSATEKLYWARYAWSWKGIDGTLYSIDIANDYAIEKIGVIGGYSEVVGLLTIDAKGFELPDTPLAGVNVDRETVVMLQDGTKQLFATKSPWYYPEGKITWSSSDEEVAVVDYRGKVTALKDGEVTITATVTDGNTHYTDTCEITVIAPNSDMSGFVLSSSNLYNQWVDFNTGTPSDYTAEEEADFLSFYAGEYYDGWVYAYSSATAMYKVNPVTHEEIKVSEGRTDYIISDMAYDYANGWMYGIAQSTMDGATYLVRIDIMSGDFDIVAELADNYGGYAMCIAVATDGTMYILTTTGFLFTYDVEEETLTKVGYTGYSVSPYTQCMAYDHNTQELYWAMTTDSAEGIAYVDTTNGEAVVIGVVDNWAQLVAMYSIPEAASIPERDEVAATEFRLAEGITEVTTIQGSKVCAPIRVLPYNATNRNVQYQVADPAIAEVRDGMLYGKAEGTTTVTASLGEFEDVIFTVNVMASTGNIRGYVLMDLESFGGGFWGEFTDYDLSAGNGLAEFSYDVFAGEYYNGKIYTFGENAMTYNSQYVVVDAETFEIETQIQYDELPDVMDMAFNYSDGAMYAVAGIRNVDGPTSLYNVDLETGDLYKIAKMTERIMALCCSTDGHLYGVTPEGTICEINPLTGETTVIMETGYQANVYQSMTYDHDTGNIYWAQVCIDRMMGSISANLLAINIEKEAVVNLGMIGTAGTEVTSMYIVPDEVPEVQPTTVKGVLLSSQSELMKVGETVTISGKPLPICERTSSEVVTYESDDPYIATVTPEGVVTAVGEGTAYITASCGGKTATCRINVVGNLFTLYSLNEEGFQTSSLLEPMTVSDTTNYPFDGTEALFTVQTATYSRTEACFYAIGTDGYLWKYDANANTGTKIGDMPVIETFEKWDEFVLKDNMWYAPAVTDITYNTFDNCVYAIITGMMPSDLFADQYSWIVKLDVETGTTELQCVLGMAEPTEFTFITATKAVLYDGLDDNVYTSDLAEGEEPAALSLAWAQNIMVADNETGCFGIDYSPELDTIFLATVDTYLNQGEMGLYYLNPNTGVIRKYGNAAYDFSMQDIVIMAPLG